MPAIEWNQLVSAVRQTLRAGFSPAFGRILALLGGVVFPIVCLCSALPDGTWNFRSPWQSGLPREYAFLLTKWPAVAPLYPLLIYCMVCCTRVAWRPRATRSLATRGGVYTGVLLAVPFHYIIYPPEDWTLAALLPSTLALGVIILGTGIGLLLVRLVWRLLKWLRTRLGWFRLGWLLLLLLGAYLGGTLAVSADRSDDGWWQRWVESYVLVPPVAAYFTILMCGTAWATMTYVLMSVYVWRQHATHRLHFGLLPVLGCVGWLAAYLAAWRAAVQMALVEYAQLPTERPGCYICTAAARGHNWLVRHWSVPLSAGGRLLVNRQMQWLKAGEIALRALCPAGHAVCRAFYDRWGAPLAAGLREAWIADLAYIALKPGEWTVRLALAALRVDCQLVATLYHGPLLADSSQVAPDCTITMDKGRVGQ